MAKQIELLISESLFNHDLYDLIPRVILDPPSPDISLNMPITS